MHKELAHKLAELERKLQNHDQSIQSLVVAIRQLMAPPEPKRRPIGFIVKEPKFLMSPKRRGKVRCYSLRYALCALRFARS
jgi:hypothetical protein